MSHPNVKVKSSPIHGRGVFARKDIPKGEWIMDMGGKVISQKQADKLAQTRKKVYFVDLAPDKLLDGDVHGNHARYTNHSKKPNAVMYSYWEKGKPVVYIESLKRIKAGAEITIDYGFNPEEG